jgi:predicted nucleic acid-binding protein
MVVVADTSPINYLILLDCIDVLRVLYGRIVVPVEVFAELTASGAPAAVATWVQSQPAWLEIRRAPDRALPIAINNLDIGEEAAIRLALAEPESLLLIDEAAGRSLANKLGVPNTGTLGVLSAAATEGLIDLRVALAKLQQTNFRISLSLIERLLA